LAAKRSPQFAATYQAIARRRGKKIATTAVARKLLARAYHLLTDTETAAAPATATTPRTDAPRLALQVGSKTATTTTRASSKIPMSRPSRAR
jgi:hypothetical protein